MIAGIIHQNNTCKHLGPNRVFINDSPHGYFLFPVLSSFTHSSSKTVFIRPWAERERERERDLKLSQSHFIPSHPQSLIQGQVYCSSQIKPSLSLGNLWTQAGEREIFFSLLACAPRAAGSPCDKACLHWREWSHCAASEGLVPVTGAPGAALDPLL